MKKISFRMIATLVALLLLVPHAGIGAPSKSYGPPYADASAYAYCYDELVVLDSCSNTFSSDKATGSVALNLSAESPVGGTGLGWVSSDGYGDVLAFFKLKKAVPSVTVTFNFHVNSAQTSTTSPLGGGGADVSAFGEVYPQGCGGYCYGVYDNVFIVAGTGDSVENELVTVVVSLRGDYESPTIGPGTFIARAGFNAHAAQFIDTGSTVAEVDGVVTGFTVS